MIFLHIFENFEDPNNQGKAGKSKKKAKVATS
jgi:hypothetical protein